MTLEDLYRLLRSSHVQAQGIVDTIDEPLVVLDSALCVLTANPAFLDTFRTDRDLTLGSSLFDLGNGQWDIPDLRRLLAEVLPKATAVVDYEVTHDFPEIGPRTFLVTARRLEHPDRNSRQILVVFDDVTGRRRRDTANSLVLSETRHRMKNLMAVVGALASQTRTDGLSADEYRDVFLGRLKGLTIAHELTIDETAAVDLRTLADCVLEPYADRIAFEAGDVSPLAGFQVRPLGMVLHELATNALKYGSLAAPQGRVRLGWSESKSDGDARPVLSLRWTEEGGPEISPPDHEGFGTGMIRHFVEEVDGRLDMDFDGSGLRVRIDFPVVEEPDTSAPGR